MDLQAAYEKYYQSAIQYTEPLTFEAWLRDIKDVRHSC